MQKSNYRSASPRHRRDASLMAWRCGLTPRRNRAPDCLICAQVATLRAGKCHRHGRKEVPKMIGSSAESVSIIHPPPKSRNRHAMQVRRRSVRSHLLLLGFTPSKCVGCAAGFKNAKRQTDATPLDALVPKTAYAGCPAVTRHTAICSRRGGAPGDAVGRLRVRGLRRLRDAE